MQISSAPPPQPAASTPPMRAGRRILMNTGALAGSSLWRIFISFVLQVLITRMLGVAPFGQYVSALAYLNLSQVVSELGLPQLLVRDLAQFPQQRRALYFLALRIQIVAALVVWGVLAAAAWLLPITVQTQAALLLVGASLPFYAITSASETLFQASERMELVMGVEATINTLIMAVSVALLFWGGGVRALIGVLVVTQAVSAALCLFLVARNRLLTGGSKTAAVSWRGLLGQSRPFYGLALADVLLHRLDILLLNILAGDFVTGVYSIAYSLVRVMVKLIQSYWQALYPTLSRFRQHADAHYRRLSSLALRYGLMVVLPGAAIGTGIAANMLPLIFGAEGGLATPVFQILIWMTPLFLVETYAVIRLMTERRPQLSLSVTGIHIVSEALLLPLGNAMAGAVGAAWAAVGSSGAGALLGLWLLRRLQLAPDGAKLSWLLLATASAFAVAWLAPWAWWLRAPAAAALYLALILFTGVFTERDRLMLRNALISKRV